MAKNTATSKSLRPPKPTPAPGVVSASDVTATFQRLLDVWKDIKPERFQEYIAVWLSQESGGRVDLPGTKSNHEYGAFQLSDDEGHSLRYSRAINYGQESELFGFLTANMMSFGSMGLFYARLRMCVGVGAMTEVRRLRADILGQKAFIDAPFVVDASYADWTKLSGNGTITEEKAKYRWRASQQAHFAYLFGAARAEAEMMKRVRTDQIMI